MKKLLVLLAACSIGIVSCKDDDPATVPTDTSVGAVPATFTQKVLIEEFTGTWCGWCTDGAYRLENIVNANAGIAYGVSVHQGDVMEIPLYAVLDSVFNNNSFPAGMINRVPVGTDATPNRGYWATATNTQKAKIAKCGLALSSSISGTTANVTVHCGFKEALTGSYNLTVYLVEDHVTGGYSYNQQNYLYNDSNYIQTPYYSMPSPIVGFHHMQVVRKVMTANMGDPIPGAEIVAGNDYKVSLSADITGFNSSNMKVVAFIHKEGVTTSTRDIMNVQQAELGSVKDWN